jgi:hypothetical protein
VKPAVTHNVPANRMSVERLIGPRLGKLFVPNTAVSEYKSVLWFPTGKVVTSGEIARALDDLAIDGGPTLAAGHDFTKEARTVAAEASCDIISEREQPMPVTLLSGSVEFKITPKSRAWRPPRAEPNQATYRFAAP